MGPIDRELSGAKMLRAVGKFEDRCEKQTDRMLPKKMGRKAPACYEYLGQVLAYADMIGSCAFSCLGNTHEDHVLHYLVARTSSFGRAALRLARMGFYDESLNIVRSMGEIANLFALFMSDPGSIEEWKKSDRSYRLEHFSPAKIRRRIVAAGEMPIMDEDTYRSLCEVSTHPVPQLRPQQFNHAARSMTGGIHMQGAGFLVVLNEMAVVTGILVFYAGIVLKIPKDDMKTIAKACAKCAGSAGSVHLGNVADLLKTKVPSPPTP